MRSSRCCRRKGLADAKQLHALEHAWQAAAERTPHGEPIVLTDDERALARAGAPQAGE